LHTIDLSWDSAASKRAGPGCRTSHQPVRDAGDAAPLTIGSPARPARKPAASEPPWQVRHWSDEELLTHLLSSEPSAWHEFRRRFDRLILSCIERITRRFSSSLSNADVEDIYGQLMCGLSSRDMQKLRSFQVQRGVRFGTWLGVLARNATWDYLRALSCRPQTTHDPALVDAMVTEDTPYERVLVHERRALALSTMEKLSRRDRTLLQLLYVEDRTPEEVAAVLRISVKTVYSKHHKVRCRLLELLDPKIEARHDSAQAH
jgi:RNA polymerase sigma-70 factor, ECF subfamily